MQLNESTIQQADKLTILVRFFLPSLIGTIVILAAYVIYRWKLAFDKREMEDLNINRMRVKMEALAAEKKALRKKKEDSPQKPETPREQDWNDQTSDYCSDDSFGTA